MSGILTFAEQRDGKLRRSSLEVVSEAKRLSGSFGGAVATVVLTGVYTVTGGLRAVLYTDAAQAIILIIGSVAITDIGLDLLGGWGELTAFASENVAQYVDNAY